MLSVFTDWCSGSVWVHLRLSIPVKAHCTSVWIIDVLSKNIKEYFQIFSTQTLKKSFHVFTLKQKPQHYSAWNVAFLSIVWSIVSKVYKNIENVRGKKITEFTGFVLRTSSSVFTTLANGAEILSSQRIVQRNYLIKPCVLKPLILCMWCFLAYWVPDPCDQWFTLCCVR